MPNSFSILFQRISLFWSSGLDTALAEENGESVQERFHKQFFKRHFCNGFDVDIHWMGVPVEKCPMDLWIYQEMVSELQPDVIIETGTGRGGTTLYLASLLDYLGNGKVISIDKGFLPSRPQHHRISYLTGNSTSDAILEEVNRMVRPDHQVLVILDSDHKKKHVLREIENFGPLVTEGSYLIVEDTHFNGHPLPVESGSGPLGAVEEYLAQHNDFKPDPSREKFELTFNPKGYLLKAG